MWVMNLQISRSQHRQLIDWAKKAEPNECCGLMLGDRGVVESMELTANVAEMPEQNFEIDPSALIAAEKRARSGGRAILGYFHSHPNGLAEPSKTDARMANDDGRIWMIIAGGQVSAWRPVTKAGDEQIRFVREAIVEG